MLHNIQSAAVLWVKTLWMKETPPGRPRRWPQHLRNSTVQCTTDVKAESRRNIALRLIPWPEHMLIEKKSCQYMMVCEQSFTKAEVKTWSGRVKACKVMYWYYRSGLVCVCSDGSRPKQLCWQMSNDGSFSFKWEHSDVLLFLYPKIRSYVRNEDPSLILHLKDCVKVLERVPLEVKFFCIEN